MWFFFISSDSQHKTTEMSLFSFCVRLDYTAKYRQPSTTIHLVTIWNYDSIENRDLWSFFTLTTSTASPWPDDQNLSTWQVTWIYDNAVSRNHVFTIYNLLSQLPISKSMGKQDLFNDCKIPLTTVAKKTIQLPLLPVEIFDSIVMSVTTYT